MFQLHHSRGSQLIRVGLILTMALMLLSAVTPVFAGQGGPTRTVFRDDINDLLGPAPPHPCTGEALAAQGNVLLIVEGTSPDDYWIHVSGQGTTMTGLTSGGLYRFNGALNQHVTANGSNHYLHHFSWLGPGQNDNFIATFISHVTFRPDGTVAVEFDLAQVKCQ